MPRLTNQRIAAAIARGTNIELADDRVTGLSVRVGARGVATWTLRWGGRDDRGRVALGRWGVLSIKRARSLARARLADVASGVEPEPEPVGTLTMADLLGCDDAPGWYLSTYVRTAGKRARGSAKTEQCIRLDLGVIRCHLRSRPALMAKGVDAVTIADLDAIKSETSRGAWPKVRAILKVCLDHAVECGQIRSNPTTARVLRTEPARKLERFLSTDERTRVEAALVTAEELGERRAGGLAPRVVRAIRLLALTGMRRSEVVAMRWEHVDLSRAMVKLPASKTGADQTRPLSSVAVAYLAAERDAGGVARMTGSVCEGVGPDSISRGWEGVRKSCGLEDVRLHDLRHSVASDLLTAGVPLAVVGRVLGHRDMGSTQRYAHLADDAVRDGLAAMVARQAEQSGARR